MEIDDNQNASAMQGAQAGTAFQSARPVNTAMWLSTMDPISSQIMESLITSNVGPQALASSFNLFNFIFQNFENFANELNKNPIDDLFKVKIDRPTEPKERPNPNNAFEMIRTMQGHISAGMWALILYCRDGYLSVHLLPSDFVASIVDDKMSDFPAYLEIVQQENSQGANGTWQIENKPIVIEVIPGLIRHLVEHLIRVSRGEATANERFSFFSPRKTRETSGVFTMPASVQAAIQGEVLPDTTNSNGQSNSSPPLLEEPPGATTNQTQMTRSQLIRNLMQEARAKADAQASANQIYYDQPNQSTLAQEKTVAVQQFSMPGAPDLNFRNPNSSASNLNQVSSPPPFLAPPAGLFGGAPNLANSSATSSAGASPPASLLNNSNSDSNQDSIDTPAVFNEFKQPDPAPAKPSSSATSLAALLNANQSESARSSASSQDIPSIVAPPPFAAQPPDAFMAPPAPPPSLSTSQVMSAPPPPPAQPQRPPVPPAPQPPVFNAPPPPPGGVAPGSFSGGPPPPPMPSLSPPSPPPMPSAQAPGQAPPPPPAEISSAPNATPNPATQSAPGVPGVPVVPFPQFTQTSMPAASLPESVILESASEAPPSSPLSLFEDDEEVLESEGIESNEVQEPTTFSDSTESESLSMMDSNDVYQSESEPELVSEANYDNAPVYDQPDQEVSAENYQQYDQGEYENQEAYDANYQEYAGDDSQQESVEYEQYETDDSYQMNGEVNGFALNIQEPLDSPEALGQIMEQSQRVVRDGCYQILGELDQVLDSLRAAAQVAMHNDNIQAVTDIMQHSKQIKALRERLVSFQAENVKEEE